MCLSKILTLRNLPTKLKNSNNRLKRGGIYWNKFDNNWQGQLRFFGKRYTKNSKDKSIVEEWLENIKNKFEIEN